MEDGERSHLTIEEIIQGARLISGEIDFRLPENEEVLSQLISIMLHERDCPYECRVFVEAALARIKWQAIPNEELAAWLQKLRDNEEVSLTD